MRTFNSIVDLLAPAIGGAMGLYSSFNSIVDLLLMFSARSMSLLITFQFYSRSSRQDKNVDSDV